MKKLMIIALVIVGLLFVPAASAEELYYSETLTANDNNLISCSSGVSSATEWPAFSGFYASDAMAETLQLQNNTYIIAQIPIELVYSAGERSQTAVNIYSGGNICGSGTLGYFRYMAGESEYLQIWLELDDFTSRGAGIYTFGYLDNFDNFDIRSSLSSFSPTSGITDKAGYLFCFTSGNRGPTNELKNYVATETQWENRYEIYTEDSYSINYSTIKIYRDAPDVSTISSVIINANNKTFNSILSSENKEYRLDENDYPFTISIYSPVSAGWYNQTFFSDDPDDPGTDPTDTILRTGTVTMTDNNGTTIDGFEVTAINHYTGEEYTVSTETDVAVMTLPMDRSINIRNPQTGEYEEAPIGYYRFYGQAPGYKMLNEEGIKVSVMPEKYGSYQLCDIRVTSETGYLTGKHQFQIRSRSDNSILQSGTISAKSATTGEWYNTTVSGGIATLVLPYDTSNSISQYAGNYYVYATSPGYEDSDYGTQIVVMPHTVSEIRHILLTPIGGIPNPGNVTLRIQAFSETGPGVVNAEIFIAGVLGAGSDVRDTYTASSTGYLTVSVPGNSTYDIVASGTGYYDSAHRVEVFTEDPPLIEIKLYLSGAPTVKPTVKPTTQPTGWITPTPTQTTPPIQEDNIIGLSVKGLAKGFGIDYDTALLLFGLMIIFGAGGMVMSSVKGGAMEFIAGSIVGTFVAFALGLIPIWIFIIIVVVFGAYVLRVFVQGGQ